MCCDKGRLTAIIILVIVCPKILKIMPVDAYNASGIILKCLATHSLCSNLPTPNDNITYYSMIQILCYY